jgi:hypothetical protein
MGPLTLHNHRDMDIPARTLQDGAANGMEKIKRMKGKDIG